MNVYHATPDSKLKYLVHAWQTGGTRQVAWVIKDFWLVNFYKTLINLAGSQTESDFCFQQTRLKYLDHPYNITRYTERRIELPLAWHYLESHKSASNILEIGATLGHYYPISHDVVDKFEQGPGIINQDILHFQPKKKYDLIISVSTLEHIGWDDDQKQPDKILQTIMHAKQKLLKPGGLMMATVPIGYNPHLDQLLKHQSHLFNQIYFFKRVSVFNLWQQVEQLQIDNYRFGWPYNNANAIAVLEIRN